VEFLLLIQAQAADALDQGIYAEAADDRHGDAEQGGEQLAAEGHATQTAERGAAEDAAGNAAPGAAQAVQRPHAEHIVDLPAVLRAGEQLHEEDAGDGADGQGAERMDQVGTAADGDQAGERAVMGKARIVPADQRGGKRAADHGHQRVHGDQPADAFDLLRAHDIEAEPADDEYPGAECEEGNARRRVGHHAAFLAVAAAAGAELQYGHEADPAADSMHDHRPGEVVEFRAEAALEPGLDTEGAVPGDAFEEGIDEADDEEGGGELRVEARTFGDAARDDGRNRGGEGEQEEELGQAVAVVFGQDCGTAEEVDTVGDAVADEEIGERRYREIDQDLDQGVDLVLLAHGAELEK